MIRRLFGLAFLALILGHKGFAQCEPPKYRKSLIYEDSKSAIAMNISIRLEDFAPARLLCLADGLRKQYHDREEISIGIFSSHKAARRYFPPMVEELPGQREAAAQMHGAYLFNVAKREEYVLIYPWGEDVHVHSFDTRIDLPVGSKPQCHCQINARCLLELKRIYYPIEAMNASVTGTVTMTGTIDRNGKMAGISIAETNVAPIEKKELLARKAVENIKTWRFEESPHQDAFRITYSYAINTPPGHQGNVEVRPELPDHVFISLNPLKIDAPK